MKMKRALSGLLVACMLSGIMPTNLLAADTVATDTTSEAATDTTTDATTDVNVLGEIFPQAMDETYIDTEAVAEDLPYHNGTELLSVSEPFYLGLKSNITSTSVTNTVNSGIYGDGGTLMSSITSANGYQLETSSGGLKFDSITVIDGKSYSLELLSVLSSYEGDFDGDGTDELALIVGARTKGAANNHYDMLLLCTTDLKAHSSLTPVTVLYEGETLGAGTRFANPDNWISSAVVVCGDFDGDMIDEIVTAAPMNRGVNSRDIAVDGFYGKSYAFMWDLADGKWYNAERYFFGMYGYPGHSTTTYSMAVGDVDYDGYDDLAMAWSYYETYNGHVYQDVNLYYGNKDLTKVGKKSAHIDGLFYARYKDYHKDKDPEPPTMLFTGAAGVAIEPGLNGGSPTIFVAFKDYGKWAYSENAITTAYGIMAVELDESKTWYTDTGLEVVETNPTYIGYGGIAKTQSSHSDRSAFAAVSIAVSDYDFGLKEVNNQISSGSIIVDGIVYSYQKAIDGTGYNYNLTYQTRLTPDVPDEYIYEHDDGTKTTVYNFPLNTTINNAGITYYNTRGTSITGDSGGFIFQYKQSTENGVRNYIKYYDGRDSADGFREIFSKSFSGNSYSVISALPNVDEDSIYLKYNDHYFFWSDPIIVAALASPPYFDALPSENYTNAQTGYGRSTSTETGTTQTITTAVGPYISTETGGGAFGATAIFEQESEWMNHAAKELEETKTFVYTETYSTQGGENSVVISTAAFDAYNYTAFYPGEDGTVKSTPYTVVIPRGGEASLLSTTIPYEDYLALIPYAEGLLPTLEDIFPTPGDPTSYPSFISRVGDHIVDNSVMSFGYNNSFPTGKGAVDQTIETANDTSTVNSSGSSVSVKLGGGVSASGEFLKGILNATSKVIGGQVSEKSAEYGKIVVNSTGATYSGTVYGQDEGLNVSGIGQQRAGFNWELFKYTYRTEMVEGEGDGASVYIHEFPVINYKVTGVTQPQGVIPTAVGATPTGSIGQVGPSTGSVCSGNLYVYSPGVTREATTRLVGAPEGMSVSRNVVQETDTISILINGAVQPGTYTMKLSVGGVESDEFDVVVDPYVGANDIPIDIENVDFGSVKYSSDLQHGADAQTITITNTTNDVLILTATMDETLLNNDSFEITQGLSKTLIPINGTDTITIKPKTGLEVGTYYGSITLEDRYGAVRTVGFTFKVLEPTAPGKVFVYDRSDYPLQATWMEPKDTGGYPITDYEVTIEGVTLNEDGTQNWISTGGRTLFNYSDESLMNGRYKVGVRAKNELGYSETSWFWWEAITYTPPSEIQNLKVIPGDGLVTVSWDDPLDFGGVCSDGSSWIYVDQLDYRVGVSAVIDNSSYIEYYDVPRGEYDYTITGLTNGVEYNVTVIGSHFTSTSISQKATPTAGITIPSRPRSFTATMTYGQAKLDWKAPQYNGGSEITGYKVSNDGGATWTEVAADALTYTFTGTTVGEEYTFVVCAVNSAGESPTSTVVESGASNLDAPDIFVIDEGYQQVEFTWEIPTGDVLPEGYELKINDGEWTKIEPVTFDSRYVYVLTGLENDKSYNLSLRPYNREGPGPEHRTTKTPSSSYPPPVSNLRAVPKNGRVEIYFDMPEAPEGVTYSAHVLEDGAYAWWGTHSGDTFDGNNGQTYTFAIAVGDGNGIWSTSYVSATPSADIPDPPSEPIINGGTAGGLQVTANWSAPASNNGSEVTYYNVDDGLHTVMVPVTEEGEANGYSYTFRYGTQEEFSEVYRIRVCAVNAVGESAPGFMFISDYKLMGSTDIVLPVGYDTHKEVFNVAAYEEGSYNEETGEGEMFLYPIYSDEDTDDGCWSLVTDNSSISLDFRTLTVSPGLPAGTYKATLVWDNKPDSAMSFDITIKVIEGDFTEITDVTLPNGCAGLAYNSAMLKTAYGDATWSVVDGSLPTGITLSNNGLLSGVAEEAGEYTFTVQASSNYGTSTKEFTINVAESLTAVEGETSLWGDADLSGRLTANDAAYILKHSVEPEAVNLNQNALDFADVDDSGEITADDAAMVLQKVLDYNLFPVEQN